MKRKDSLVKMLAAGMTIVMSAGLMVCGGSSAAASSSAATSADASADDEMSYDDLVAAAKSEGKLVFYGANSYLQDAADNFAKEFGIDTEFTQLGDTDLMEKITTEASSGSLNADLVCAQDSYRVQAELVDTGYAMKWSNSRIGDIVGNPDCTSLVWYYDTKTFEYNPELVGDGWLTNIWAVTDPDNAGHFTMKDPTAEGVNFDMLTMLTSDENASKLADAYKAYYNKDIELTTDNAGYEWIKMMLANQPVLTTSDSDCAQTVGAKGQDDTWIGYYSTQRFSRQQEKDWSLAYDINSTEPFGAYAYPVYSIVMNGCAHPNAAKLFSEWLLSEDGWKAFESYYGGFSANPANVHATDYSFDEVKDHTIQDDAAFLTDHRADVEDFWENNQ